MNKKFLVTVGLFAVAFFAALFLIGYLGDDKSPQVELPPPAKKISVYVSGQVKNISVVELEDNGNLRAVDAVNLAGGLTEFADTEAVNLADAITDGQHVHIPTKEIYLQPSQNFSDASSSGDKVNINTADADKLQTLKGVGPATAQKIIEYRQQNGPFKTIDEIKNIRGIGDKKFATIKDKITV